MYLTYQEYTNLGGTLDLATFNKHEFEAETMVDWYTFNRLKNESTIPEPVKHLMKYLIDSIQQQLSLLHTGAEAPSEARIASQSNDGVSISYDILSASDVLNRLKEQESETIRRYLQGVTNSAGRKLLYRGLYPGE